MMMAMMMMMMTMMMAMMMTHGHKNINITNNLDHNKVRNIHLGNGR